MAGRPDQPTFEESAKSPAEDTATDPPGRSAADTARTLPGGRDLPTGPGPEPAATRIAEQERSRSTFDRQPRDQVTEQLRERLWRLPAGHPSSPYDGKGALRPPVPDPRERERPLPEEGDRRGAPDERSRPRPDQHSLSNDEGRRPRPAEREQASGRDNPRWRDAVPRLLELWQKHEEKWPDSERPPADRSADEPGSWRSDSGHPLSKHDNRFVESEYQRIAFNERRITERMEEVERASIGQLAGKEFRLKGQERFKEKVAAQKLANPDADVREIMMSVRDGIRYTIQYSDTEYARGVIADLSALKGANLELIRLRNSWYSPEYKGINSLWIDNTTRASFEIQFHTPVSFEAKQLTHPAYERLRTISGDAASESTEARELHDFQRAVCAEVSTPANALSISDYP